MWRASYIRKKGHIIYYHELDKPFFRLRITGFRRIVFLVPHQCLAAGAGHGLQCRIPSKF
jgi:hypothetical protein